MSLDVLAELRRSGFEGRLIPIGRLEDARRDLASLRDRGDLDADLDRQELGFIRFEPPESLPNARTLVLASFAQPQVRVTLHWKGRRRTILVPPTYDHASNALLRDALRRILGPLGFRVAPAALPLKLLAVRTGLGAYGRNNLCYVDGRGSYHRLAAFFTDYHARDGGDWSEPRMMDACRRCSACRRNCPTGAIGPDRFLVRAERCLTFHNERPAPFPGWLDPAWHHRLFGCMRCQTVCPANRGVPLRTEEGPSLSPRESEILLGGVPFVRIPAGLKTKFKRFGWTARDYQMLPRNLQAVFGNPRAEGADRGAP